MFDLGNTASDWPEPPEDQYGAHLSTSMLHNEQAAVPSRPTEWIITHSNVGGAPINEFTTEGYFSMAFPTLFSTGAADFLGQSGDNWQLLHPSS